MKMQVDQCSQELSALTTRWMHEYDLTMAEALGVMECEKERLFRIMRNLDEQESAE